MSLKWAQLLQIKAICLKRATYYIPPKGIHVLCALYKKGSKLISTKINLKTIEHLK